MLRQILPYKLIPSSLLSQRTVTCRIVASRITCEREILPIPIQVRNITMTIGTGIDKSFRKNRERIAQQLLIEYDNTAFGGMLLQQSTQQISTSQLGPTSLNSINANTSNWNLESLSFLDVPNVTIKWSNRLRTTAGRARLQLHKLNQSKQKKQRSLSHKEQVLQMQQHFVQNYPTHSQPISNDISVSMMTKNDQCLTTGLHQHRSDVDTMMIPPQSRRTAIVELSTKVVDDIQRLQTTLLHELCHVAAWIIDGNIKPPHGPYFQKWAQIATKAIPSISITTKHNFKIHYKYAWKCINPTCTVQTIGRHSRRSIDVKRHVCGKCHGQIQAITTNTGVSPNIDSDHTMPSKDNDDGCTEQLSKRPLNEYQRFVQKHSKIIARELREKRDKKVLGIYHNMKKSSTNLSLKTNTIRSRMNVRKTVPVSSQSILQQCAKLWQKLKKRTR
jgi:predicted SprT family Zn-dependent metalloprotease